MRIFKLAILFLISTFASCNSCGESPTPNPNGKPNLILWAWERPEDLRFADVRTTGVAFLEQTLALSGSEAIHIPRRHPLKVESAMYLIAVTRIEMKKGSKIDEANNDQMIPEIVSRIVRSSRVKNVRGIQIDFDAVRSQREFYRKIIEQVRQKLPEKFPLTITALASWCTYDLWLKSLPIDEAVPMLFDMGTDKIRIEKFLESGSDWNEPHCKKSYGLSIDQTLDTRLRPGRRRYYFNRRSWKESDLEKTK